MAERSGRMVKVRTDSDWEAARKRISAAYDAIAHAFEGQGDWAEDILRRRAADLAKKEDVLPQMAGDIVLRVAGRSLSYALPADAVVEVVPVIRVAIVPGAPPSMLGLMSLRGHVLRLFDLDALVGASAPAAEGGLAVRLRGIEDVAVRVFAAESVEASGVPEGDADALDGLSLVREVTAGRVYVLDMDAVRQHLEGEV